MPGGAGPPRPRALPAAHDRAVDGCRFDLFDAPRDAPRPRRIAADRAPLARYALDLLDHTADWRLDAAPGGPSGRPGRREVEVRTVVGARPGRPAPSSSSARRRRASWSRRTGPRRRAPGRAGRGRGSAGPVADQHGGDRVAGEVGQRPGLGHEPVDADDQADAVDQLGAVRAEPAGQGGQAGAGDAGRALRGDDHEDQQRDLLADRQRVAQRLGDEQRGHRQVDRGAVEVERVAGRDDDADGRLARRRRAPSWRSAAAGPTPRTRSRGSAGTRGRGSCSSVKMLTPVTSLEQRAEHARRRTARR